MKKFTILLSFFYLCINLYAQHEIDPKEHRKHLDEQIHLMTFAPPKHDLDGQLLPLQSYNETLTRSMSFILDSLDNWFQGDPKTLYDSLGNKKPVFYYYANLSMDGRTFRGAPDNYVSYPAFHHAIFIQTFLRWYVYSGDEKSLNIALDLANWNLENSTPIEYPYGGMPYSTFNKGKPGGFVDGNAIMPDKAAIMALAYLHVFDVTGNKKYYQAAERIAEKLASNQLSEGNWPFRVNPKTKEVQEGYTSSVIYQIRLFETLDERSKKSVYHSNRNAALEWLLSNPVKTGKWSGYYEDIRNTENLTNWDCIDVVRYLLENANENPEYLKIALKLEKYISGSIIKNGQTFVNQQHQYAPAEGIREQKACFVTMGVHSAHWANMMVDLYKVTGEKDYLHRAVQTMNYVTYHLQPDGRILVGVDYKNEKNSWAFNQYWFSCHLSTDFFLLEFLGLLPEYSSTVENHILSYESAIKEVTYDKEKLSYTSLQPSTDILKITFKPTSVFLDGKLLEAKDGTWVYDVNTQLIKIIHKGGKITIL